MGIFNFRSKKSAIKVEVKSGGYSYMDMLKLEPLGESTGQASMTQNIGYYLNVAPLKNAVDILDQAIHTISPLVFDTKKEIYSDEHSVLNLLKKPNPTESYSSFISQLVIYLLITGNIYIVATGQSNRPPSELYVVTPQTVKIQSDDRGFAERYDISSGDVSRTYYRKEVNGQFRYYTKDDSSELFHGKYVNPIQGSSRLYGLAKIQGLQYSLEQYTAGDIHNLSLLERGGRPSLIYTSDTNLTQDQVDSVKDQLEAEIIGKQNAGRTQVLECGLDVKDMSVNNKDMDYKDLRDRLVKTIYNHLRIPLAFISENTMTYNNLEIAQLNLYDNAVLPLASKIFSELTHFLMPRYPNSENLNITFDHSDVLALEPRRNEELNKLNDLGVLSINEMRELIRYENVPGGDAILVPASETPIAEAPESEEEKKCFEDILRKQVGKDGKALYTEETIKKYVREYVV